MKVRLGEEWWRFIGVCEQESGDEVRRVAIGGRKGRKGNGWWEEILMLGRRGKEVEWEGKSEEGRGEGKKLKVRKINKEGRKLSRFVEEQGMEILNGDIRGNEEGKLTFTGEAGDPVIDYVLGDEREREGIESMMVEGAIDSVHHPIVVWIRGKGEEGGKMKKAMEKMREGRKGARGKGGGMRSVE